jgi:hypothetical protein
MHASALCRAVLTPSFFAVRFNTTSHGQMETQQIDFDIDGSTDEDDNDNGEDNQTKVTRGNACND